MPKKAKLPPSHVELHRLVGKISAYDRLKKQHEVNTYAKELIRVLKTEFIK